MTFHQNHHLRETRHQIYSSLEKLNQSFHSLKTFFFNDKKDIDRRKEC